MPTNVQSGQAQLRILIITDERPMRQRLTDLIQSRPDWICCGQAPNFNAALAWIGEETPDVALLDFHLGCANGVELIRSLKAWADGLRILTVSYLDEITCAEGALQAGALGYITADQPDSEFLRAIQTVAAGRAYAGEKVTANALEQIIQDHAAFRTFNMSSLTEREMHIFKSVAADKNNVQIAAELNLTPETVETCCHRIRTKLGLESGAPLADYARQQRL